MRDTMLKLTLITAVAVLICGCTRERFGCDDSCPAGTRCIEGRCVPVEAPPPVFWPSSIEKDVDILFVIDNSSSMADEQQNLSKNFPALIETLKSPQLNNKIPNVHLGIITTDLGAGNYSLPSCEVSGGDGGKLQATPRLPGCVPPSKPYIEYLDGVVNINNPPVTDPIEKVKQAFQCIAEVGTGGCGFEAQIEAARRALDPKLNRNPGFVRKDAYLAIVFITDEDDCSAQKPQLFDPNQNQINTPLGPLTSFRCFEFGVQCDCPGGSCKRTTLGPRTSCKPAFNWLYKVDDYVSFFKGLKPAGRLIMFAIAGPTDKVEVGLDSQNPTLLSSCQSAAGKGRPAIRIKALIDGIAKSGNVGYFNEGIDASLTKGVPVEICSADFSPALRLLGKTIVSKMSNRCLQSPPLTKSGGVVCRKGDLLGTSSQGGQVSCQASCLERVDCLVSLWSPTLGDTMVQRCDKATFLNVSDKDCGSTCPCWRLVPKSACVPLVDGSPYGVEILRKGSAEKGSKVLFKCATSVYTWGSAAFAAQPQCS
jgi:hypothetical protein